MKEILEEIKWKLEDTKEALLWYYTRKMLGKHVISIKELQDLMRTTRFFVFVIIVSIAVFSIVNICFGELICKSISQLHESYGIGSVGFDPFPVFIALMLLMLAIILLFLTSILYAPSWWKKLHKSLWKIGKWPLMCFLTLLAIVCVYSFTFPIGIVWLMSVKYLGGGVTLIIFISVVLYLVFFGRVIQNY